MQWQSMLREGLIKTDISLLSYDKKWGRFIPDRRFNVDQVQMSFDINCKTTYKVNVENRKGRQTLSPHLGRKSRTRTRKASIPSTDFHILRNVCIGIIFRGTSKRVSGDEIKAYHPGVDVSWQQNAWADTKLA